MGVRCIGHVFTFYSLSENTILNPIMREKVQLHIYCYPNRRQHHHHLNVVKHCLYVSMMFVVIDEKETNQRSEMFP